MCFVRKPCLPVIGLALPPFPPGFLELHQVLLHSTYIEFNQHPVYEGDLHRYVRLPFIGEDPGLPSTKPHGKFRRFLCFFFLSLRTTLGTRFYFDAAGL